jgi:LmbE family N-acetylglucosaminyl deacetylase
VNRPRRSGFQRPLGCGFIGLGLLLAFATPAQAQSSPTPNQSLRVVIFGAHPDDPESGCGGLIALLTKSGHEVIVAYATCFRGTRKIGGESEAVVRRREATEACKLLGARPHFFDYAHEKLQADTETLQAISTWLKDVKPNVVVTHWPLDTHPNHHATSSLVWQCYLQGAPWSLYFFEVMTNQQTLNFRPDLYVNVEAVADLKRKALACHKSQDPDAIWKVHEAMARQRGSECGVTLAEAYTLVAPRRGQPTLPVPFVSRRN